MARILIGNIKGPKGDTGPQGEQGPVGPQGPQGPLPPLVNNALSTEAGVAALDAVMGKTLQDQITQVNSDIQNYKYNEDDINHYESVYSLFKNSISSWGDFHNMTYHFRIAGDSDPTFGNAHFVAYIMSDTDRAVFSAIIISKWTGDVWSMIFTSYDDTNYTKKLS